MYFWVLRSNGNLMAFQQRLSEIDSDVSGGFRFWRWNEIIMCRIREFYGIVVFQVCLITY